MLLYVVEFVLFILFVFGVITQILIPGATNRPYFPLFRRRDLEKTLAEAKELRDEIEIRNEIIGDIAQAKKEIKNSRQETRK